MAITRGFQESILRVQVQFYNPGGFEVQKVEKVERDERDEGDFLAATKGREHANYLSSLPDRDHIHTHADLHRRLPHFASAALRFQPPPGRPASD